MVGVQETCVLIPWKKVPQIKLWDRVLSWRLIFPANSSLASREAESTDILSSMIIIQACHSADEAVRLHEFPGKKFWDKGGREKARIWRLN
jgi:hypothetical protein